LAPALAGNSKPHFNLWEADDPKFNGQNVVQDDHMWAQAIWGYEKTCHPRSERQRALPRGHGEWWVIMRARSATISRPSATSRRAR
jgi:hypothetical protein